MYIVTGVSRGLGKAIVEELLERKEDVMGIGRSHSFNHPHFSFLECDFSQPNQVDSLIFPVFTGKVTLINNAGVLGDVKRISEQKTSDVEQVMSVNVISPMRLLSAIYSRIENKNDFTLVNISSGAANRAIPSWASYCASKAALNMLTETFFLEEQEKENFPTIYAVAPGVIDTDMQVKIRAASSKDFSSSRNFHEMKNANQLFSPSEASKRLINLLNQPFTGQVQQDLRNIELV